MTLAKNTKSNPINIIDQFVFAEFKQQVSADKKT